MKNRWGYCGLICGLLATLLVGCSSHKKANFGQQYKDGHIDKPFEQVDYINSKGRPINGTDFNSQVLAIRNASPALYNRNMSTFAAISDWLKQGADTSKLSRYGITAYQMEGEDSFGNVMFTGYYTPVVQARHTAQGEFQYPIYRMPRGRGRLPSRADIYAGALDGQGLELAYSNSLMDNFIMDVQGSGYVDFGDGSPLNFFAFGGKNGRAYRSIGRVLIDRGEVAKEDMSMQAIRHWGETHSTSEVRELLSQNPSFVFFNPKMYAPVKGSAGVPLIAKASVASDRSIIPTGTTLLTEIPLLDNNGRFTGKYEMRLMIALDVGGAIKGQHFDIYQGIGNDAGHTAGFYNHYGRVWVLKSAPGAGY